MRRIYFNPRQEQEQRNGRISNRHWHSYELAASGAEAAGPERGGVWRGGATKLRIHNSFIWPYLHIFSALRRRKKRAEIGIWLAFVANILAYAAPLPCSTSPLPQQRSTLPWLQSYSPTVLVVVARALPRHSSNSSHVIVENETNFCNLIAFRVDAEQGE